MINKRSFYFIPVAFFAVLGLFTSLVHYHSEGLECLDHAEEAHIIEYEVNCPVSTLVSDAFFIEKVGFDAFISFDVTIYYNNEQTLKSFSSTKLGRSPPFIA